RVSERMWREIAECDAGSWFNRRFPERARREFATLRIPKLAEVFARYGDEARYYIETKNPAEAPRMEEKLVATLDRFGLMGDGTHPPSLHEPALLPTVILQSFSEESLRTLGRLAPAIPRVRLIESEV